MSNKISNARIGAVSQSQLPYVEITANKQPNAYVPNTDTYEYCIGDTLNVGANIVFPAPVNLLSGSFWNNTRVNPYAPSNAINFIKTTADSNGNVIQYISTLAPSNFTSNPPIEFVFSRIAINPTTWDVWCIEKGEIPCLGSGAESLSLYGTGLRKRILSNVFDLSTMNMYFVSLFIQYVDPAPPFELASFTDHGISVCSLEKVHAQASNYSFNGFNVYNTTSGSTALILCTGFNSFPGSTGENGLYFEGFSYL